MSASGLSELTGLEMKGEYVFESITVKSTEKRLDGFFRRKDGDGPDIFLEVQGYDDPKIYWRLFQELFTYYAQADEIRPFSAVFLFTDKKYDPKNSPISDFAEPNRLIRLYLSDCLKSLGDKASPLTVLKPLTLKRKKQLPEAIPKWKAEIDSLNLSESMNQVVIELMESAIISRFPKITVKEIQKMLHYTPIEKTVVGQELIMMGVEKGRIEGRIEGIEQGIEQGVQKGKIIGKIHATQRFLKRRITSEKKLLSQSTDDLKSMLRQLETELMPYSNS